MSMVHCRECGVKIAESAPTCPKCGAKQRGGSSSGETKTLNWTTTLIVAIFAGWLGVDRFMMGHIGLGILKLFTFGVFGIMYIIDIILIAMKKIQGVEWE